MTTIFISCPFDWGFEHEVVVPYSNWPLVGGPGGRIEPLSRAGNNALRSDGSSTLRDRPADHARRPGVGNARSRPAKLADADPIPADRRHDSCARTLNDR
jgi:hypothetical protein